MQRQHCSREQGNADGGQGGAGGLALAHAICFDGCGVNTVGNALLHHTRKVAGGSGAIEGAGGGDAAAAQQAAALLSQGAQQHGTGSKWTSSRCSTLRNDWIGGAHLDGGGAAAR